MTLRSARVATLIDSHHQLTVNMVSHSVHNASRVLRSGTVGPCRCMAAGGIHQRASSVIMRGFPLPLCLPSPRPNHGPSPLLRWLPAAAVAGTRTSAAAPSANLAHSSLVVTGATGAEASTSCGKHTAAWQLSVFPANTAMTEDWVHL